MDKPILVWYEALAGARNCEVPALIKQHFFVRSVTSDALLKQVLEEESVAALVFDFDYPDRHRLALLAETKQRHASVPLVMLTIQHSESLSTWAFRAGALDVLVKPVNMGELEACIDRLLGIHAMKATQGGRMASLTNRPIPRTVPRAVASTKDRLAPAVAYVQQHYNEQIYSDVMARLCDMSASRFSHAFSKTYGMTFQEFLLRYRVRRACQHLLSPARQQISEIAYSVGFSDPSYFSRVFKRYIGISPSDFMSCDASKRAELIAADDVFEDSPSATGVMRQLTTAFPTT